MSEPTDRFVIEIGSGTVGHIIDTDVTESRTDAGLSFSPSAPGKKMCTRGYRDYRFQRVPFSTFVEYHEIDKTGFEGDAPDEICSYCWSNTREELQTQQERVETKHADRVGTVGYCLRWKQKGRARDEWYDIVVRPETTMAELDSLVCRFTTLDDLHLRMYGLEEEYLDSSLNVLPDHQCSELNDPSYTNASEMTVGGVAELTGLWEGDRLSLIYDFGTPSYYYCLVKAVYDPDTIDDLLADSEIIDATETAGIIREKRP